MMLIFSPIRIFFDKLWLRDENYIFYLLVGQKIIFMMYEAPPRILKKSGCLVCTTD